MVCFSTSSSTEMAIMRTSHIIVYECVELDDGFFGIVHEQFLLTKIITIIHLKKRMFDLSPNC